MGMLCVWASVGIALLAVGFWIGRRYTRGEFLDQARYEEEFPLWIADQPVHAVLGARYKGMKQMWKEQEWRQEEAAQARLIRQAHAAHIPAPDPLWKHRH